MLVLAIYERDFESKFLTISMPGNKIRQYKKKKIFNKFFMEATRLTLAILFYFVPWQIGVPKEKSVIILLLFC